MADTEDNFAELSDRCDRTIAYLNGIDPSALEEAKIAKSSSNSRMARVSLPGAPLSDGFRAPQFPVPRDDAYAILRSGGVSLGKPDFLQHLGPPNLDG